MIHDHRIAREVGVENPSVDVRGVKSSDLPTNSVISQPSIGLLLEANSF